MSTKGNRGNPNQTRTAGRQNQPEQPSAGSAEGGSHQESRDYHKHSNPGQDGHKPQRHTPAQEKH